MKFRLTFFCVLFFALQASATRLFIPMDAKTQTNHLKAYGIAYAAMQHGIKVQWLLNYKGGSFVMELSKEMEQLCRQRTVACSRITEKQYAGIIKQVNAPSFNGNVVTLEKAPAIAVYTPPGKKPWDDAVTLALTYAEIPFDKLYASEVLAGNLDKYDWLHLHPEDFTGRYGKFWAQFRTLDWYQQDVRAMEALAAKNGFKKVSQMQLAVVKKIRAFVAGGGNLFAMCSATQTFDIALAAANTDICAGPFDGDPVTTGVGTELDYTNCIAFKDFSVDLDALSYTQANIDNNNYRRIPEEFDLFTLAAPPARFDQVPAMLCQNHTPTVNGFMGQATAFRKAVLKPGVQVLGDFTELKEAKYIHGELRKGSWTFLGGHDPEDYQHMVYDPVTDLALHPNSPGYRLILNNVLVPAAARTVVPTVIMHGEDHKDAPTAAKQVIMEKEIKMYPNPATSELIITLSSGTIQHITVLNTNGQEVISKPFAAAKASVDMKALPPGMYLIKVNGEYAGKIIKE